jgi:NADPH-dependent curcumin reductase CurA
MRNWMDDGESYFKPIQIGELFRAGALGEVVTSNDPAFAPGDLVLGLFGVQEYATVAAKTAMVSKIRPLASLPVCMNALGMPGLAAYFGLLDVGRPQPGETVVVSSAAGAIGAQVGQIAKIKGCRAVGIAGGAEKCAYLRELGFAAAIDYKAEDVAAALREHCPDGIHVFFDTVGGDILDAALARLARHARVVLCGATSQINTTGRIAGPSNYLSLLDNRASMTGMNVLDCADRYEQARAEMAGWFSEGKLRSKEHIVRGLENFPAALHMLFTGENHGKVLLEV